MNGRQGSLLVAGDYGASDDDSDSESVQQVDKHKTSKSEPFEGQDISGWSVLHDQATGYPYYWNPQTNEVRWDKPPELDRGSDHASTRPLNGSIEENEISTISTNVNEGGNLPDQSSRCALNEKVNKNKSYKISGKPKSAKNSKSFGNKNTVFIGPSLPPEPKPEEIALQKVKHFEENLASILMSEIEDELPPDWNSSALGIETKTESNLLTKNTKTQKQINVSASPRSIYAKPFTWKKSELLIHVVKKCGKANTDSSLIWPKKSIQSHSANCAWLWRRRI